MLNKKNKIKIIIKSYAITEIRTRDVWVLSPPRYPLYGMEADAI